MESIKPNIEQIKKQERTEKIIVFSLLLISLAVAFFTFFKNGNSSASTPKTNTSTQVNSSDGTSENSLKAFEKRDTKIAGYQDVRSKPDTLEIETINDNTSKEGVFAVGLFSSPENALNVKLRLDSLGFKGAVKIRDDGKLMVGVEADKGDTELMNSVKENYTDAIFIKN